MLRCDAEDTKCYALLNPSIQAEMCKDSGANDCDWTRILAHYAQTEGRAGSLLGCHSPATECYALRYDDLFNGYCKGQLSRCPWKELVTHWAIAGHKEGRTFGCPSPSSPPPSPPSTLLPPVCRPPPPPPPQLPPHQQEIILPASLRAYPNIGVLVFALELAVLTAIVLVFGLTARQLYRIIEGEPTCLVSVTAQTTPFP